MFLMSARHDCRECGNRIELAMKYVIAILAVLGIGAVTLYFYSDHQIEIRLSEEELLQAVTKKLPFRKTYLIVFDVNLDNPRIMLVDGTNRVAAGLDVMVEAKIGKKPPVRGSVDLSGNVRYAPEDGEFYLVKPEIEKLTVEGISLSDSERVDEVLTKALASFFKNRPIYTLKESDTKQAAARLILKNVAVDGGELILTLGL